MDLLKQCRQWFEQNEIQKVIDTLEAIPAGERTPELDSELAKAYIAIAEVGEAGRPRSERRGGRCMKKPWSFSRPMRRN